MPITQIALQTRVVCSAWKSKTIIDLLSAFASQLSLNSECAKAYCDDCFSVLSSARSRHHLKVLELVYIDLCTTS